MVDDPGMLHAWMLTQGGGVRWTWVELSAFGATGLRIDAPLVLDDAARTLAWIDAGVDAGETSERSIRLGSSI
jgi:hypothetical protein